MRATPTGSDLAAPHAPDPVMTTAARAVPPLGPTTPAQVAAAAATAPDLATIDAVLPTCRACPRLVAWREQVAVEKRAAFRDETYWGRPVPGFGDEHARVMMVGLAPAAHGGNRTGRLFTGDPSGDFLFAALHRTGFASQPTSRSRDDGLVLTGLRMAAPVRCAPQGQRPTPQERHTCGPYVARRAGDPGPGGRRGARRVRVEGRAGHARRAGLARAAAPTGVRSRCRGGAHGFRHGHRTTR